MKVLLFCPTYRLEEETKKAIFDIKFDCFVDYFFTKENPKKVKISKENEYYNIWLNFKKARELTIIGRYDYLFIIENDIIPPPNAFSELKNLDSDIATGIYRLRPGHSRCDKLAVSSHPVHFISWSDEFKNEEWKDKEKMEVTFAGTGCCLVKRSVLEEIEFKYIPCGIDITFYKEAREKGFKVFANTKVFCGHKDEDGKIYWP